MTDEAELRLYILVRTDIEIPVGKAFAQVGHAVLGTIEEARKTRPDAVAAYLGEGSLAEIASGHAKIALRANLREIQRSAQDLAEAGIPYSVIQDAGRTVFSEPTITCMGIGPVTRSELPKFIRKLRLF